MTDHDIEQIRRELGELRDREAIRDLVARYGMSVDGRDLAAIGDCFAESGVFRYVDGSVLLQGRHEVVGYYDQRLRLLGATYHYPHSQLIAFDGENRAHGVVNAHAELALLSTGDTVWVALRYNDRYVREAGSWRFAERVIAIMYYMKLADLPREFASTARKRVGGDPREADLPEGLPSWKEFWGNDAPPTA